MTHIDVINDICIILYEAANEFEGCASGLIPKILIPAECERYALYSLSDAILLTICVYHL